MERDLFLTGSMRYLYGRFYLLDDGELFFLLGRLERRRGSAGTCQFLRRPSDWMFGDAVQSLKVTGYDIKQFAL